MHDFQHLIEVWSARSRAWVRPEPRSPLHPLQPHRGGSLIDGSIYSFVCFCLPVCCILFFPFIFSRFNRKTVAFSAHTLSQREGSLQLQETGSHPVWCLIVKILCCDFYEPYESLAVALEYARIVPEPPLFSRLSPRKNREYNLNFHSW